ncbi:intersectin-EH binding protein Ibp1 [Mycobacterium sp. CVI_P3]|uniref:Intersectin-EH binding protein Ibp1 n=1 Tax=Mycobacterium pinniadriaticum TaxID=2994102 RepID=A0ABT3SN40_9MYCO|nr:intersectin-EH binding protein Ibp1 [Mycobacterium pinniadriaticum]MCX2934530.1 intersectin-EH binding protein Ibp1 [Mycobacterium pinniadriaticum]MCX2940953.1 intersectin-EH binding protein Ibp1 [Mycobacterium pinniadriaticum]
MRWKSWKSSLAVVALGAVGALAVGTVANEREPVVMAEKCSPGETLDPATDVCMPALPTDVVEVTTPVGGGLPEVDGVPCTGSNTNECIGLGEQELAAGPTVEASSTLTAESVDEKPTTVSLAPPA